MEMLFDYMLFEIDISKIVACIMFYFVVCYSITNQKLPKYLSIQMIKMGIEEIFEDKNLFGKILVVFGMIIMIPIFMYVILYELEVFIIRLIVFIWNSGNKKKK